MEVVDETRLFSKKWLIGFFEDCFSKVENMNFLSLKINFFSKDLKSDGIEIVKKVFVVFEKNPFRESRMNKFDPRSA